MNIVNFPDPVVIVADGSFPQHAVPLKALHDAGTIVCCDGAVSKLVEHGLQPSYIVGDMDSIAPAHAAQYAGILYPSTEQDTKDLTKAVHFCCAHGATQVTIVGATGLRDDHSIGNIALLADYAAMLHRVEMLTDHGRFTPLLASATLESYAGQQVSVFCLTPHLSINSEGLKYPLQGVALDSWWKGTLNEALDKRFSLLFDDGRLLIFRMY
ncbi:MAG: thiamine diphosphokinase [Prevotellaceae bacterium]|jgi:thiamine pyrophosphokinase|nr:thiamine diphosphokinase [Prevotellaceae bacterium]